MFGWDTYAPGHSPPLDPRLGPDRAPEMEVQSGRAHTRNEFGNAQGDAIQGPMNMVPSLPTQSYRGHGSPADLQGSFQTGLVETSRMQGYIGLCDVPSPNTDNANMARTGSVDEVLRPKPSGGSNRRRVQNYAVDDTGSVDEDNASTIRRQRNTIAARRYRQKGRDRIAELESALRVVEEERDRLKLELARKEAEVDALREVLRK